jgi:hypothetical protein
MSNKAGLSPVPDMIAPFEIPFLEKEIEVAGKKFRFRELSVAENDACLEASRKPNDDIDGRIMMRLMMSKSAVEPKLDADIISKLPSRIYIKLAEAVNDINAAEDEPAGDEGKD